MINTQEKIKVIGIYKITSPLGRIYIGQSINIKERWNDYFKLKCKNQIRLYRSLLKHEVKNHKFEILEECSIELLNEREIYWGLKFNVLSKNGLNCRLGGSGNVSEETRLKMSKSAFGKKKSKKHCKNISKSKKGQFVSQETREKKRIAMLGKKQSKEACDKRSKSMLGRKQSLETIKRKSISMKGKCVKNIKKPILQYDLQGNFIKEWESYTFASRELKIHPEGIGNCARGKIKTSGGYIWKYK